MEAVRLIEGQGVSTLDKKIAVLLESLCDRPFGDANERPFGGDAGRSSAGDPAPPFAGEPPVPGAAPRLPGAPQLSVPVQVEDPGQMTAALASVLSGTATDAQRQAFQEAAMRSSAVRLDAQSALAFVDGIEQAPATAPAHLLAQVLAPAGGAASGVSGGSKEMQLASAVAAPAAAVGAAPQMRQVRDSRRWLVAPRARMAAACAVLLTAGGLAGGLTWSQWRPAGSPEDHTIVPVATNPKNVPLPEAANPEAANPEVAKPAPVLPTAATAPATLTDSAQGPTDPCAPRGVANAQALAEPRPASEPKAPSRAPDRQLKSAVAPAPDPGCPADANRLATSPSVEPGKAAPTAAGRNPQADRGPVRADRPTQPGGNSPAILSAPGSAPAAARPALPAPSAVAPVR
jgi:hypothetical protein